MAYALADFTSRSILMSVRRGSGLGETVTMYRVYYVRLKRCVTGAHSRFFLLYGRIPKLHTILYAGIKKSGKVTCPIIVVIQLLLLQRRLAGRITWQRQTCFCAFSHLSSLS